MSYSFNTTSKIVTIALTLMLIVFNAVSSNAAESNTRSVSKSKSTDTFTLSRYKRAPGWGKRAPGWGKRNSYDESNSNIDSMNTLAALRQSGYLPEDFSGKNVWKRAPGWGKRSYPINLLPGQVDDDSLWNDDDADFDDYISETAKRAPGWGKRAPGWGKRNSLVDLGSERESDTKYMNWDNSIVGRDVFRHPTTFLEPTNSNEILSTVPLLTDDIISAEKKAPGWGKRAPGWGKRNFNYLLNDEASLTEKLAPGWGKRNYYLLSDEDLFTEKRAPGWGKRAPGWGKRAPGWGKRAPGWGKRAPGWGKRSDDVDEFDNDDVKRAPGWGKRAVARVKRAARSIKEAEQDSCQKLQKLQNDYMNKLKELSTQQSAKCGNIDAANKPSRK